MAQSDIEAGRPMKNASELEWYDISDEESRSYTFPGGDIVTIEDGIKLSIKRSEVGDSHRIMGAGGRHYYIPAGWIMLSWEGEYTF